MINLGYFTLDTVDIDRAKAFYGDLFGWTFEDHTPTYAHVIGSDPACGFTKAERAHRRSLHDRWDAAGSSVLARRLLRARIRRLVHQAGL
jgi:predicted enzyme related to lactoylglutathione lyase